MPGSRRPVNRVVIATFVAVLLGVSAISAAAADLGGLGVGQLYSYSTEVTVDIPEPEVLAADDFSACNNLLDGTTDSLGNVWTDHWGRWQCLGGDVVRSQFGLPLAHASVDVGRSDHIVASTTFSRVSQQFLRSGPGISLFTDGFFHMYVIYERDLGRVTLGKWSPWSDTTLTSAAVSDLDSGVLSVVIDRPSLTVQMNGSTVLTYDLGDLSDDEQDHFFSQTRFGLESDWDNWSRFDSFRVETLP